MITAPPGEPSIAYSGPRAGRPAWSNISVGAIVLRGRLPGSIRLAIGMPSGPAGSAEKSVSWLFRMKPSTMWNEPNADSTVVVSDGGVALCVDDADLAGAVLGDRGAGVVGGAPNSPGFAVPMLRCSEISAARPAR